MRLSGEITSGRPLLVVALDEEAVALGQFDLPVLLTEPGKVNASVAVSRALSVGTPSAVINLGTAGALRAGIEGIIEIASVVQHDYDSLALFELTGRESGSLIELAIESTTTKVRLATGDSFVADASERDRLAEFADLVDMEGYAIAAAGASYGVPVRLIKHVSDAADADASESWRQSVDRCAHELALWWAANDARLGH